MKVDNEITSREMIVMLLDRLQTKAPEGAPNVNHPTFVAARAAQIVAEKALGEERRVAIDLRNQLAAHEHTIGMLRTSLNEHRALLRARRVPSRLWPK